MASGIRSELALERAEELTEVCLWLAEPNGRTLELAGDPTAPDRRRARVRLGRPVTAARAVIATVVMQRPDEAAPLLAGTISAVAGSGSEGTGRLVFSGRPAAWVSRPEARMLAAALVGAVARQTAAGRRRSLVA